MKYLIASLVWLASSFVQAQNYALLAKNAEESREYVKAAQLWREYAQKMIAENKPDAMPDYDLEAYLTALRSEANCLYMIDDYKGLHKLVVEYDKVLRRNEDRLFLDYGDEAQLMKDNLQSYADKMWGSYYYGLIDERHEAADSAEQAYMRALERVDKFNQRDVDVIYQELAQLYYKTDNYNKALECLNKQTYSMLHRPHELRAQIAICLARCAQNEPNDRRAEALLSQALDSISKTINCLPQDNPDYWENLRKRGKILMIYGDRMKSDRRDEANKDYSRYVDYITSQMPLKMNDMSDEQKEQHWLALHAFLFDCFRIGEANPEMLYNVALFARGYLMDAKTNPNAKNIKWTDVRNALKEDDCVVEFVVYRGENDRKCLGAITLKKNYTKPNFLFITDIGQLLNKKLNNSQYTVEQAISADKHDAKDYLYNDRDVADMIWSQALMNEFGEAKNVYFVPDGVLNQLAVEYIIPDTTKNVWRLSSSKVLVSKRNDKTNSNALLVGGIDYYAQVDALEGNDEKAYDILAQKHLFITNLNASETEINSIAEIRHNASDSILKGNMATEHEFCKMARNGYGIIHISTHGLFTGNINTGTEMKPTMRDNSMSESVIILAGASNNLENKNFNAHLSDGILSAKEIEHLKMDNTECVVLSACQTALGHNTEDGVYGIQRAFKSAGVKTVIVSLWSVDEMACFYLMKFMYEEMNNQNTTDMNTAFNNARRRLAQMEISNQRFRANALQRLNRKTSYNAPRYTNPFIIIDAF